MTSLRWMCVAVTVVVLLAQSSGLADAGPIGKRGRKARQPPQGKCLHISGGGKSGVHFYVCCNNCDENGGNPSCDKTTYQGASTRPYCGHCGVDEGNGKFSLHEFKCGGCAGQSQMEEKCHTKYPGLRPGFCWVLSFCFQSRCKERFQHRDRRSLDSEEGPFCGDDTCDPGETATNCPFDCCPAANPDICGRNNGTCPPECCSESSCCCPHRGLIKSPMTPPWYCLKIVVCGVVLTIFICMLCPRVRKKLCH